MNIMKILIMDSSRNVNVYSVHSIQEALVRHYEFVYDTEDRIATDAILNATNMEVAIELYKRLNYSNDWITVLINITNTNYYLNINDIIEKS